MGSVVWRIKYNPFLDTCRKKNLWRKKFLAKGYKEKIIISEYLLLSMVSLPLGSSIFLKYCIMQLLQYLFITGFHK